MCNIWVQSIGHAVCKFMSNMQIIFIALTIGFYLKGNSSAMGMPVTRCWHRLTGNPGKYIESFFFDKNGQGIYKRVTGIPNIDYNVHTGDNDNNRHPFYK